MEGDRLSLMRDADVAEVKLKHRADKLGYEWAANADELKVRLLDYRMRQANGPSLTTLNEIAESIGVTIDYLVSADEAQPEDYDSQLFTERFLEGAQRLIDERPWLKVPADRLGTVCKAAQT